MAYTTIDKPDEYFNTKLYTGNGSTQSITGVNFQPDFVWIKGRSTAPDHFLFDVVRGVTNSIRTNVTSGTYTEAQLLTAFDSDGFTIGTNGNLNASSQTFASWNWLANGAGSSNTDGSITSTVSANTTSGFSIVKYTGNSTAGATVGHGLGVAPKVVIVKILNDSNQWCVYHGGLNVANPADYVTFFTSSASTNLYNIWNDTAPSSSVVTLGDNSACNTGNDYIAYCFAEKKGFSKLGGYTGNGSSDGVFCYTGMKPSFVMVKGTDISSQWTMIDNKRDSFNVCDAKIFANTSDAEGQEVLVDFLSNGFKIRSLTANWNASGNNYIYMAFAEHPLVSSTGVPCTAR